MEHLIESDAPNLHASMLTTFIQQLLAKASIEMNDLDAIAVSAGPGSYTGLRIGYAVAKGLCYTLNKPMISISTLEALAEGIKAKADVTNGNIVPVIDARRTHVYAAVYSESLHVTTPPGIFNVNDNPFQMLFYPSVKTFTGGNALRKISITLEDKNINFVSDVACSAANMVQLSYRKWVLNKFEDVAYCQPQYVNEPELKRKTTIT
jgi:tRNA threonylcarbamoyladenosine biosynthesis protein TsaB